jgi:hypothetical protein
MLKTRSIESKIVKNGHFVLFLLEGSLWYVLK